MDDPAVPLQVRGLTLARGGRRVLHDIDLDFCGAEVTALVGPSGAGKSSLLRCLNRLEDPTSGTVVLEGRDIRSLEPTELRRRVGMIFQTPIVFEGGVRSNLLYGMTGVHDDELVQALIEAGLSADFLDRPSSELSVGQAQRVCIARALVRRPTVLLMDEPTAALDRYVGARIEELVRSLCTRDLTIVLVTHDLRQAARVAQRAAMLVDGVKIAEGLPAEIERVWEEGG